MRNFLYLLLFVFLTNCANTTISSRCKIKRNISIAKNDPDWFNEKESQEYNYIVKNEEFSGDGNLAKDKNIFISEIILANKTTEILHGTKAALDSEKIAKSIFKEDSTGVNLPNININKIILNKNIVELIAFVNKKISKSEIRRLIKSNGVKIDNKQINDEKFIINKTLFEDKGFIKLSLGKKKHFKVVVV